MQLDHKLMDSLFAETQSFSELAAPHRPIQQFQHAPATGTRHRAVAPRSIRNGLETASSPTSGRMPPIHLAPFGESDLIELVERSRGLAEIKIRTYRDF